MSDPGQLPRTHPKSSFLRRLAAWGTVLLYTVNAPFGYAILAGLSHLWRHDPLRRARRLQHLSCTAYRLLFDWLRLVRVMHFDWRAAVPGLPDGPCVVVANHPTLMDMPAVSAVLGRGFTIAKPAVYRRRMLRPLLVGAGHVEGPEPEVASTARAIAEAVDRLGTGMPLVIFPEATRSPPDRLGTFRRLAFEIACRAKVPVVSIGIDCEPVYLSKEGSAFAPPDPTARLQLELLSIDEPAAFGYDSRRMCRVTEARYRAWLGSCRLARGNLAPYIAEPTDHGCPTSSKTA